MITKSLIMICGLPGSGKTYFANALAKRLKIPHLNSDIVRKKIGKMQQYDQAAKKAVYRKMQQITEQHLRNGNAVIVDATFSKMTYRQPYIDMARKNKFPLKIILITAAEDVIRKRISIPRPDSEADFAVYQKIKKEFEPITQNYLELASDELTQNEMIAKTITYLQHEER